MSPQPLKHPRCAVDSRIVEAARVRRVADETSDVLSTILLVGDNERLQDQLFGQLVDLLLEGILIEQRVALEGGTLSPLQFCVEREELMTQCRAVALID